MFSARLCEIPAGIVSPVDKLLVSLGEYVGRWPQGRLAVALSPVTGTRQKPMKSGVSGAVWSPSGNNTALAIELTATFQ